MCAVNNSNSEVLVLDLNGVFIDLTRLPVHLLKGQRIEISFRLGS